MTPADLEALRASLTPTPAERDARGPRDRDRTGLLQREMADRMGISAQSYRDKVKGRKPISRRDEAALRGIEVTP